MQLNKPVRMGIGLATLWVLGYPFLFFILWFGMVIGLSMGPLSSEPVSDTMAPFLLIGSVGIFALHCLTILIALALTIFYIAHLIKNYRANETVRIVLGVGFFIFSFLSMPIYYYLYIWQDLPPDWALAPEARPGGSGYLLLTPKFKGESLPKPHDEGAE